MSSEVTEMRLKNWLAIGFYVNVSAVLGLWFEQFDKKHNMEKLLENQWNSAGKEQQIEMITIIIC